MTHPSATICPESRHQMREWLSPCPICSRKAWLSAWRSKAGLKFVNESSHRALCPHGDVFGSLTVSNSVEPLSSNSGRKQETSAAFSIIDLLRTCPVMLWGLKARSIQNWPSATSTMSSSSHYHDAGIAVRKLVADQTKMSLIPSSCPEGLGSGGQNSKSFRLSCLGISWFYHECC